MAVADSSAREAVVSRAVVAAVSVLAAGAAVVVAASRAVAVEVVVSVLVAAVASPSSSLMILSRAGLQLPGSFFGAQSRKRRAQKKSSDLCAPRPALCALM